MKNLSLLFACIVAFTVFSCSPVYYIPNTQNVPMVKSRGNVRIVLAGNQNQGEAQGALGTTKSSAVMLNMAYFNPKSDSAGNGGSGFLAEGGYGYYKGFLDKFVFDIYGLAGVGNVENHFPGTITQYPGSSGKLKAGIFRFGLQPSFSYYQKYFSVSASARMTSLNYTNISGSLIHGGVSQATYLNQNNASLLLEPALTVRGGLENIKLQIQLMQSLNISHPAFKQDKSLLSFGLHISF